MNTLDPMVPDLWSLKKVVRDTDDTFTVELTPNNKSAKFAFKPGQFNMLYIFGVGEIPISISGDPRQTDSLIHTTRVVGTVTLAMNQLKRGGALGVRGPFGTAWPVEQAQGKDVVILAGGIGLAPLRPALYEIISKRKKYKNVFLLYGSRTPEDILFEKELKEWRKNYSIEVMVTVDRATDTWKGNVGVVTHLIKRAPFESKNTVAMICGPEIMMQYCLRELKSLGCPEEYIYLSMERNMKCAIGFCGHCQYGSEFICKDGPVFSFSRIKHLFYQEGI